MVITWGIHRSSGCQTLRGEGSLREIPGKIGILMDYGVSSARILSNNDMVLWDNSNGIIYQHGYSNGRRQNSLYVTIDKPQRMTNVGD